MSGASCDQDFHCQPGERCQDGGCQAARPICAPCSDDSQCGLDLVTGLANPCVAHGDGQVCAMESSARECPAGLVRSEQGYCLPVQCGTPMGCVSDADCPQGRRCAQRTDERGLCLEFCRSDDECPARATCEPVTGQCLPPCEVGSCPLNQRCHDDGRCASACAADSDCPAQFSCREGRCRLPGCASDSDCPPQFGIYCHVESRECREGCLTDQHCSSMQICRDGACTPRPCRTKELDCGLGQFCCANGLDDGGEACPDNVAQGLCFDFPDGFCAPCQDSDDCSINNRHGSDTVCIDYQDRDGNSLGKACAIGCRDMADCPRGFGCTELQDDGGQTVGHVCTAAMCVTGELEQR